MRASRRALLRQLVAASVYVATGPYSASSQTPPVLRVGATMADDLTPVYWAYRSGMFRKSGVDVDLTILSSGGAVTAAVIGGALDIGHSSLAALLVAHSKGIPVVLIAAGAKYDPKFPAGVLVQSADADLKTGKDLAGKTIAVSALGDFSSLVTSMWVEQTGGDAKSLHFVEMPQVAQAAALEEHRVDAAVLLNPDLTQALMTGKVKRLSLALSAIGSSYMFAGWFAMNDWASKHTDLVKAFAKVASDAAAFTNTHHEATVGMMSEATKIPLDVLSKMDRADTFTTLDPARIQPMIDFAAKYQMLPHGFPAKEMIFTGAPA